MSMHVRVALDDEGPIAVKTATTADDVARLRLEAQRLRDAAHPGLVSVVSPDPAGDIVEAHVDPASDVELSTRFAGDPVSHWTGSLACVAGLGAAVATTLADLHDMGLVHGRLDSTHILVGADGRPRLCGLSHPGGAAPEDDVAALGRVLGDLLERVPVRRRRSWPWVRADGAERRALEQVIARALDPVPSRRPNARSLATSMLGAVPEADLPAGRPPATELRPGYVPPDEQLLDLVFTHELTDDERWAQAFGDDPLERPIDSEREVDPPPEPAWRWDAPPIDPGAAPRSPRRGGPSSWARLAAGSGALAVVVVAAGVVVVGGWRSPGSASRPDAGPATMPAGCIPAEAPAADVDGDGCPEALLIEGGTISAGSAQWTLGEPGDVIAVGDWECDGRSTPALLRPVTGDVFVFPGWAADAEPVTVEARDRLPGAVALRAEPGDDGCDQLVVELSSGATTIVEASR
jgi:eukaryotic-like serine/threonine-protein kinase